MKLRVPVIAENKDPRKNFVGILRGLEAGLIQVECDGVVESLPLANLDKARLSPEF